MKRTILIALIATLCAAPVWADGIEYDKAVSMDRLPRRAQSFLQTYYPTAVWLSGKKEVDGVEVEYKVQFKDGTVIEFRRNGRWKKISQRQKPLPASLIPEPIQAFISQNFPHVTGIWSMEQDRQEIEVRLSDGRECTFSAKSYLPMEIDY